VISSDRLVSQQRYLHKMLRSVTLFLLFGCAVGRIHPDGQVIGLAIGQARIEHCELEQNQNLPCHCDSITGGALSTGFVGTVSALVTVVSSLIMAGVL